MHTYLFIGTVLPDSTRVTVTNKNVTLEAGPDYPAGTVSIQIINNRVIGTFLTEVELTDVGCLTVRNIVQGVASSICDVVALMDGAWTYVTIDTCLNSNCTIRMQFGNSEYHLASVFKSKDITSEDIFIIIEHPEGFYLHQALSDVNSGLMQAKFMRSHFYRAVESLRNSVTSETKNSDDKKNWEAFRTALGIERIHVDIFQDNNERHANYSITVPMSGKEVEVALAGIAEIISKYVRWFKANRLNIPRGIKP